LSGRTETFKNTIFTAEGYRIGELVMVEVERSRGSGLFGRAVGRAVSRAVSHQEAADRRPAEEKAEKKQASAGG